MKFEDFERLSNAFEAIEMASEVCDTSLKDDDYETWTEVNEWNNEFAEFVDQARSLKEQLIFVFKIEEAEE